MSHRMQLWRSIALRSGVVLLVLWLLASAALAVAMRQPPDRFGRIMKHAPVASFLLLPFETLWTNARDGALRVGDQAPDFTLETVDHRARVQLAPGRGKQPVVLIFGSYT